MFITQSNFCVSYLTTTFQMYRLYSTEGLSVTVGKLVSTVQYITHFGDI